VQDAPDFRCGWCGDVDGRLPKVLPGFAQKRRVPGAGDFEKREALTSYYTLLYDRIAKLDPKLKTRTTEIRNKSIHRLSQTRIDPTDPIDPRERDAR